MKLLFAEDEPKVANAVKTGLEEQGLEVTVAFDGLMAEKYFDRDSFDCIILDINLPHKNGLELCKQFRTRNKKVPIIVKRSSGLDQPIPLGKRALD